MAHATAVSKRNRAKSIVLAPRRIFRLHVVGYSLGSLLASEIARRRQCASLTLICSPWYSNFSEAEKILYANNFWIRHKLLAEFMCRIALCKQRWFWRHILPALAHTRRSKQHVPTAVIEDALCHSFEGVRETTRSVIVDHRPIATEITAKKILIVNGTDDKLCYPHGHYASLQSIARNVRQEQVVRGILVPSADHLLLFSHTNYLAKVIFNNQFLQ